MPTTHLRHGRTWRAQRTSRSFRAAWATSAAVAVTVSLSMVPTPAAASPEDWSETAYRGEVEVVRTSTGPADDSVLTGQVFVDANQNGTRDGDEDGLAGVMVTNGREVVRTDDEGGYRLPAFDNMTVSITQPSGYQVPMDEHNIPQFHYNHLPEGPRSCATAVSSRPGRCRPRSTSRSPRAI